MTRAVLLGPLFIVGAMGFGNTAPRAGSKAQPEVAEIEKVKDNLYMITGGGGNTAAFVTANGVVLVDTKLPTGASRSWTRCVGHRQAGDDDHQHPHARRSHRQQRVLPGVRRGRRAGEHQGEHGEDAGVQGRQGEVPAGQDLQGPDDAPQRARIGSTSITSAPATPTATPSSCSRRCAWRTPATCLRGKDTPLIDTGNGGSGVAYPDTLKKAAARDQGRGQR